MAFLKAGNGLSLLKPAVVIFSFFFNVIRCCEIETIRFVARERDIFQVKSDENDGAIAIIKSQFLEAALPKW